MSEERLSTAVTFRTPLLPFDAYVAWGEGLTAPAVGQDAAALAAAVRADTEILRSRLRAVIERPAIREALFIASPDLDASLSQWLTLPDSEGGIKVERTLVRYFSRMTGRCTPFGLFSGVSCAAVAADTRLSLADASAYQRHTRIDNDYLFALTTALAAMPELRAALCLRPSSGLYRAAGRLRYAEARMLGRLRTHHLVDIEPSPYLLATLERARGGSRRDALARGLCTDDPEIEIEEAEAFIDELVDSQILVHDLSPAVTGPEPIADVVTTLQATGAVPEVTARLRAVTTALSEIDDAGLGVGQQHYRAVMAEVEPLLATSTTPRLFQVDMIKPAPGSTVGRAVLDEIGRGIEILRRITEAYTPLRDFRERFVERYEERQVPLVQVLDEEAGIGLHAGRTASAQASPLLADLAFPSSGGDRGTRFGKFEAFMLRRLHELVARGERELVLSPADVDAIEADSPARLPAALSATAIIVARSAEELETGRFSLLLRSVVGPSGARISGRFCHASAAIEAQVREHLRAEESLRPDAIFAEVVHLPQGRLGNIICRPALREYEIPYLGRSGVPPGRQIPVQDLLVSVARERIVLRSRRLGKEIVPRLSSAHNYAGANLGIYTFLCSLQAQDGQTLGYTWGPFDAAPFLPRVRCGNVVLARAQWRIGREDLEPLATATRGSKDATSEKRARVFAAAQSMRERLSLPRHVVLADGDNELPIDLDNVLSVDSFVHLVKSRPTAVLHEHYPGPDELCVHGPEGRFCHELVVGLVRGPAPRASHGIAAAVAADEPASTVDAPRVASRRFAPAASPWLYAKLYAGTGTLDEVLRSAVGPLAREATARGSANQWFFIRYSDPEPHVRVRFRGEPERLRNEVLPALARHAGSLLEDGRVWRFALDTYEREVERYGGSVGIELAEEFFAADSDAALEIVELLDGDEGNDARWRLAFRGVDIILEDLGFMLEQRRALMIEARESLRREFRADTILRRQIGAKYRNERAGLEALLDRDAERCAAHPLADGFLALDRQRERRREIAARLQASERAGRLTRPLTAMAWSFVHMHCNRLLHAAARAQELVLYDFLERTYAARIARDRRRS